MSYKNQYNNIDFKLPIENIPYIFKEGLFIRELNPIIEGEERTINIKCSQLHCK